MPSSGDEVATGEDGDILEHRLAPVAETRRLDGDAGEHAAQLVDDQRGQRVAVDVLGDDQQAAPLLAICSSSGSRSFIVQIFFS